MMTGWLDYLGIDRDAASADEDAFAGMTAALAEIRRLQERLQKVSAPPELFGKCANVLRQTFSPSHAQTQFMGLREQFIAPEISLSLGWAAWCLRELDDPDMDVEAYQSLIQLIKEQEERLLAPQISAAMHEMLDSHVRQLKIALRLYKIEGVNVIHQAVREAYGELQTATAEQVLDAESTPESRSALQKGLELLGKAAKAADAASKLKKFTEEFYQLGTRYGPPALEWAKSLLSDGS